MMEAGERRRKTGVRVEKALTVIESASSKRLAGLANSRAFFTSLKEEVDRASRYEHAISVVYFDLDNFKTLNDTLGHTSGDEALRETSEAMAEHLRPSDVLARLGGDEIALLLPETDQRDAEIVVTKLKMSTARLFKERQWPLSLSAGLVSYHKEFPTPQIMIQTADARMYEAKRGSSLKRQPNN